MTQSPESPESNHTFAELASPDLQSFLDEACALVAALAAGDPLGRLAPLLVAGQGDEQSVERLPRDAEARQDAIAHAIADLPLDVEHYALVIASDDGLLVELEERGVGFGLRVRVPVAHRDPDDGTLAFAAPVLVERCDNRLARAHGRAILDPAVLTLEALVVVIDADGRIDPEELALLEGFARTVPVLRDHDVSALAELARDQVASGGGVDAVVEHLSALRDRLSQRQLYVLACEMAFVAEPGEPEQECLAAIAAALSLDPAFVDAAHQVCTAKYQRAAVATEHLASVLMAVIVADGAFDQTEMAVVQELARVIPELEGDAAMRHLAAAQQTLRQDGGLDELCADIATATAGDPSLGRGLYAAGVEVAFASQGLDPRENRLLARIAESGAVDEAFASAAAAVFAAKYRVE